jgi:hypothetical protein
MAQREWTRIKDEEKNSNRRWTQIYADKDLEFERITIVRFETTTENS